MRPAILEFAKDVAEHLPLASPLLEIGARPADGQEHLARELRALLGAEEHIGCDIQPGPNVDRVEDVHALSFADESVGSIVSFDTLEHVRDPIRALEEMHRVLRPGGVVAISSVMFFPIHEHPWDYWRFTPEGFAQLLAPFEASVVLAQGHPLLPETVLGVGVKGPMPDLTPEELLPRSTRLAKHWGEDRIVDFGPVRLTVRELWGYTARYSSKAARRRLTRLRGGPVAP